MNKAMNTLMQIINAFIDSNCFLTIMSSLTDTKILNVKRHYLWDDLHNNSAIKIIK